MLVRSPPPGLQWVPGTVIQRTGLVSYVVKVADSRLWRRHIDHIREMPDSPHHTPPETALESLEPVHHPSSPDLPIVEAPVPPDILVPPDSLNSPNQPSESQPKSPSPTPTSTTSTPQRRYPVRIRKPPERLTYHPK